VIRDTIKEIGYDDPGKGLDYNTMNVIVAIEEQSPDIAQSVDSRTGNVEDIGAGDQGIMFGWVKEGGKGRRGERVISDTNVLLIHHYCFVFSNYVKRGVQLIFSPSLPPSLPP